MHTPLRSTMSAGLQILSVAVTLAAVAVGIALRRINRAWWRFRGVRVVLCPENQRPAAMRVDAWHAAATALGDHPDLRLSACSRWPERADCGQECVRQVRSAPDECRVLNIITQWYEGKYCVSCGQPVSRAYWTACKPALLTPQGSQQWDEIPPDRLPETLATAMPLCFQCQARLELGAPTPGVRSAGSQG